MNPSDTSPRSGGGERDPSTTDALTLPPMSRGMQTFSMLAFFVLGALVAGFLALNPLGLPGLPGRGSEAPAPVAADDGPVTLYQCPMHPQVIESEPGNCPICSMPLVAMKDSGSGGATPAEREVLYWYAPMDPDYRRDEPGLSPMGMKLVPMYADQDQAGVEAPGEIRIDPVQVQNIGVVSVPARTETIARTSRTVGILDFNAERVSWINTKFEGWIEKVHVNYVGQSVRAGQTLFEIYSPELVTTQEEYLRALDYRASLENSRRSQIREQADGLVRAARERLGYWDIDEALIQRLERTRQVERRLPINSPVSGVVAQVMDRALEGMHVTRGMDLYRIADLSTIWVHVDIYEADLPWIREGQPATVTFRNDPGKVIRGHVLFLYPELSRDTRTLKICVEIPNRDRSLRPGMYADVTVEGPRIREATVIPESAVIRSGARDLVFLDLGEGRFAPREVELGVMTPDDRVQVLDGVSPGDAVVIQAQFMLDSESRIQEAIAKFMQRRQGDGHRH